MSYVRAFSDTFRRAGPPTWDKIAKKCAKPAALPRESTKSSLRFVISQDEGAKGRSTLQPLLLLHVRRNHF